MVALSSTKQPLLTLVNNALLEMGVITTPFPSLFGNSDPTATQVLALAKREGIEASKKPIKGEGWSILRKEYTFTLLNGIETYAIPDDLKFFIAQTTWDRSFRWQLLGPLEAQEWQVLKSGISPVGPRRRFRVMDNLLYINPIPAPTDAGQTIAYEYVTMNYVQSVSGVAQSSFLADTDYFLLDDDILTLGLKWRFKQAKGLDYTEERSQYDQHIDLMVGRDANVRSLPLNAQASGIRLLNAMNVPDTGFGS